ncbi:MAG: hypothetical protein RSD77_06550 [Romboutsia sp.]
MMIDRSIATILGEDAISAFDFEVIYSMLSKLSISNNKDIFEDYIVKSSNMYDDYGYSS